MRRAAGSAWRVRAYCIFSFGNPVRTCLGEGRASVQAGRGRSKFSHVGAMLALFPLLGASWAHFSRLAALVVAFGCFFGVLECFGHDFDASWAAFSWPLGPPRPHFSRLLASVCALVQMH